MTRPTFSIVLPFYNEAAFLDVSVGSLLKQRRTPDQLILVDNRSSDGSADIASEKAAGFSCDVVLLNELRPGKVHALETGCSHATHDWIVLCDADTWYPPHYLELAAQLISDGSEDLVAVMAKDTSSRPNSLSDRLMRQMYVMISGILKRQAHTGGFGQILRRSALERVGGFSESHWPYVLLDHEIMHRLFKIGRSRYHVDLWCIPSKRRSDRRKVRWALPERLLYHITPFRFKDWFFYQFLGPRLEKRGMTHLNLREKTWEQEGGEDPHRAYSGSE